MRLIDAESPELLAKLRFIREAEQQIYGSGSWGFTAKCEHAIEDAPTVQPEIVRCKDCKHYRHGLCMKASMCVNKSENGFCDWGDRREVTT